MLLAPVLTAVAVGLSVSVGQYLPTLLIGGGRVATLTTEAVALSSGGDRRAIAVFGLMQTGAALLPFALALLVPALVGATAKDYSMDKGLPRPRGIFRDGAPLVALDRHIAPGRGVSVMGPSGIGKSTCCPSLRAAAAGVRLYRTHVA